jgi:TBC1 domain family protein 5
MLLVYVKCNSFPDVDFFRQADVQQCLTDILFIYCKLNRDVSYRQGMHELLAPFYWIISNESINTLDETLLRYAREHYDIILY